MIVSNRTVVRLNTFNHIEQKKKGMVCMMKSTELIFGYCRISTKKQSIERQIQNIEREYPNAIIISEAFTGTKLDRPEWNKLYKKVKQNPNATIVFDEVSRMSRNADDGFKLYMELFQMGVNLVFLKEPHINTESYRKAMDGVISVNVASGDSAADKMINAIMDAVNDFMKSKVNEDIHLAFAQAQKEVDYLHTRTKEGISAVKKANEIHKLNGELDKVKQIGGVSGKKLTTKKSIEKKQEIQKHSVDFGGTLNDVDCMKLTGLSRNTFYKYKRELKAESE